MKSLLWLHRTRKANRGFRRTLGQLQLGSHHRDGYYLREVVSRIFKFLAVVMFLSVCANGQDKFMTWHGISVQPGSTKPQCLLYQDPDNLGFMDCSLLTAKYSRSYLESQDINIWTPRDYKRAPVSKGYWVWQLTTFALGVVDEERQQHFFDSPLCHESFVYCKAADPVLGRSRAQGYSVLIAFNGLNSFFVREVNKHAQERAALGLPPWKHGYDRILYSPHVADIAMMVWALNGIFRTSHKVL
jgi:hypothetical protein